MAEAGPESPDGPEESPDDASMALATPVTCDGGYFVRIADDAGRTWLASSGCADAGPEVPTLSGPDVCGEDCSCTAVVACSGSSVLRLSTICGPCRVASCRVFATYIAEDGGEIQGNGYLQIAGFPEAGSTIEGTFTGEFVLPLDGGVDPVSGSFCARFVP